MKTTGRKNQVVDTALRFQTVTGKSGILDWSSEYLLTFANPLSAINPGLARLAIKGIADTISPRLNMPIRFIGR